jgi:hypothetical protein
VPGNQHFHVLNTLLDAFSKSPGPLPGPGDFLWSGKVSRAAALTLSQYSDIPDPSKNILDKKAGNINKILYISGFNPLISHCFARILIRCPEA